MTFLSCPDILPKRDCGDIRVATLHFSYHSRLVFLVFSILVLYLRMEKCSSQEKKIGTYHSMDTSNGSPHRHHVLSTLGATGNGLCHFIYCQLPGSSTATYNNNVVVVCSSQFPVTRFHCHNHSQFPFSRNQLPGE